MINYYSNLSPHECNIEDGTYLVIKQQLLTHSCVSGPFIDVRVWPSTSGDTTDSRGCQVWIQLDLVSKNTDACTNFLVEQKSVSGAFLVIVCRLTINCSEKWTAVTSAPQIAIKGRGVWITHLVPAVCSLLCISTGQRHWMSYESAGKSAWSSNWTVSWKLVVGLNDNENSTSTLRPRSYNWYMFRLTSVNQPIARYWWFTTIRSSCLVSERNKKTKQRPSM